MGTQHNTLITPEQYLELERKAEYKSEYYAGEMFAMAGATEAHNILAANALALIHNEFRRRDCRVYGSDMRVRVSETGLYTYPDLSAVCGEPQFSDARRDTLLNPILIIEVASQSTEAYDRGRKFEHYRSIGSLAQYVLIASDRVRADVYTRDSAERWILASSAQLSDRVDLSSIECSLLVADLYEKADLPDGSRLLAP